MPAAASFTLPRLELTLSPFVRRVVGEKFRAKRASTGGEGGEGRGAEEDPLKGRRQTKGLECSEPAYRSLPDRLNPVSVIFVTPWNSFESAESRRRKTRSPLKRRRSVSGAFREWNGQLRTKSRLSGDDFNAGCDGKSRGAPGVVEIFRTEKKKDRFQGILFRFLEN